VSIHARSHHGVEGIGHRQDASAQRNVRTGCPVRVARAVKSFVMGHDDVTDIGEAGDSPNDRTAKFGVLAHDSEFFFGQEVLFEQDLHGNEGFAKVVKQRSDTEGFEAIVGQTKRDSHGKGKLGNTIGVSERKVVRTFEHFEQCPHDAFSHAPTDGLFEQQFRAHLGATVRRTNKVAPLYVSLGQVPCTRHGNVCSSYGCLAFFQARRILKTVRDSLSGRWTPQRRTI